MSAFEELGVLPEIIAALEEMDWQLPTPVQTEAIPLILGGGDVAVAAETGSGKTGAFCLPIVQIVFETRHTNLGHTAQQSTSRDFEGPIVLSKVDRGKSVAVDEAGRVAQCRHPVIWGGLRATHAVASGKWYFLAVPRDDGICRFGWSSRHAALILGTDGRGFGFGGTAMKSHAGKFDSYGVKYGKNDVICCMVEFKPNSDVQRAEVVVSYAKNGKMLGEAFRVPWRVLGLENLPLFPAVAMKNAEVEIDFSKSCTEAEALGFRSIQTATLASGGVSADVRKLFENERSKPMDIDSDASIGRKEEKRQPLALILEPSRELAGQVQEELGKFSVFLPEESVRMLLLTGGGNPKAEKRALQDGRDIVAGTLGSIVGHVKKGTLSLDNIRFFVLDEADTFATDNLSDVSFLHEKVPARNNVQTLLFSATLHSKEIKALSEKIQSFPTWVDLKGKEAVPETVHHTMVRIDANADVDLLDAIPKSVQWPLDQVHRGALGSELSSKAQNGTADDAEMSDAADVRSLMLKKLKLAALKRTVDANDMVQAMVFVRTQLDGDNVESFLLQCSGVAVSHVATLRFRSRRDTGPELRYSCAVLHGGRRQAERNEALAAFKAGEVRFLICTDVAARGIDVVGLPFLVNVTLPDIPENYIHRVGRVGRAERFGLAVSLVAAQKEAVWYHTCGKPKGGVCKQRKLVDVGGCVTWLNEANMLAEIEQRLNGRVEELGSDFKRKGDGQPILYGSRAGEEELLTSSAQRVRLLQPALRKLVEMEEQAQLSFFELQTQFSAPSKCL